MTGCSSTGQNLRYKNVIILNSKVSNTDFYPIQKYLNFKIIKKEKRASLPDPHIECLQKTSLEVGWSCDDSLQPYFIFLERLHNGLQAGTLAWMHFTFNTNKT